MDTKRRRVKYVRSGREVGRDRGGGQTHTGDRSSAAEIRLNRSGKNH